MKTIHKFPLDITHVPQAFQMDEAAEILTVQVQYGKPTLWARVDTDGRRIERQFVVLGTGWQISEEWGQSLDYIGTVQCPNESYVWHVFELEQPVF